MIYTAKNSDLSKICVCGEGYRKKAHQALIYALQTSDSLVLKNNVTKWGTIWKNNESSIRAVEILVLSFPYITNYC